MQGKFLRMHMLKDATIEQYEEVVPKVIRIWKRKYQITEYVGCLEISKGGYKHVHMFVKTDVSCQREHCNKNLINYFNEDEVIAVNIKIISDLDLVKLVLKEESK
jgi:hypothetical protein